MPAAEVKTELRSQDLPVPSSTTINKIIADLQQLTTDMEVAFVTIAKKYLLSPDVVRVIYALLSR